MKRHLAIICVVLLFLIAIINRDFWLGHVRRLWPTYTPPAVKTEQQGRLNSLSDTFSFAGSSYYLYRIEKITKGWAAYYTPSSDKDPDNTDTALIVNYYLPDPENSAVSAEAVANEVREENEANSVIPIQPFTKPDVANPGQNAFFIPMYFVYPQDKATDIFITKIMQDGNNAVGIMVKQVVYGQNKAELGQAGKQWLANNIEAYSKELGDIKPSDLWFKK